MPNLLIMRYQITEVLGQGGMGVVYKAGDNQLGNRPVAIKEMQQRHYDQYAVAAFRREADILAHLMHPNLPSIHEHFSVDGCWYLVMEYIEGVTLEKYVQSKGGRLSSDAALRIGLQLCSVLHYLHTRQPGVIFRDLKPTNIMISPDEHLYLIDFGIARHFQPDQSNNTANFYSIGYAAPEQYGGSPLQTTPLSDIYGLGATLHRLLSGHNPAWNEPTPFDFAPLRLYNTSISAEFDALIMQMLERVPSKRPASMLEVKQRLQQIADQRIATPIPPLLTADSRQLDRDTPLPIEPEPFSTSARPEKKRRISRRLFLAAAGTTLVVAGGAAVGWLVVHDQTVTHHTVPISPARPPILKAAFSTSVSGSANVLFTISTRDGVNWSNAVSLPEQVQLQGNPAMTTFKHKFYLAFRGNDTNNTLYVNSSTDGDNWSVATASGIHLQASPSIASFKNKLFMAFKSNDNNNVLCGISSVDGQHWSGVMSYGYTLQGSPALAVFKDHLYLAYTGTDRTLYTLSSADGQNWSSVVASGAFLTESPSIVSFKDKLYAAFKSSGTNNLLCGMSSSDGQNWSDVTIYEGYTLQGSPALAVFENKLQLAYRGIDNALYLLSSTDGQNWSDPQPSVPALQDSPTLAVFQS